MEPLNNRYAFYMLGRGSALPQTSPLSVNTFFIVTNSTHETPVYPRLLCSHASTVNENYRKYMTNYCTGTYFYRSDLVVNRKSRPIRSLSYRVRDVIVPES